MANTLLTPVQVTRKALMILHQKLTFTGTINRQYDDQFGKTGAKIGDTVKLRLPNQYTVGTGQTITVQDTIEQSVDLVVGTQKHVAMSLNTAELTLKLDDFSERVIEPAMSVLAANIESEVFNLVKDVFQQNGTPGTRPNTLLTFTDAGAILTNALAPQAPRCVQVSPMTMAVMVDALKGLFQDSQEISTQYREGLIGRSAGFDWYQNTMVPRIRNGSTVAGLTVSTAGQTGATLTINGTVNGSTFIKGQVFTCAGVNRVHPETKVDTGILQQFVITQDVTATGTSVTLPIAPAIVTTGPQKNVTGSPAAAAALTFVGAANASYEVGVAYHRDAFAIAFADLYMPKGIDWGAREVMDGISMRIIRDYSVMDDTIPTRVDVFYGMKAIRPQLAVRIAG